MFKANDNDTITAIGVVLVSLLLTLNIFHTLFVLSIVNFEHAIASWLRYIPIGICLFKFNNGKTTFMSEMSSNSTIKTSESSSGAFIIDFEQISHIVLILPLLTLKK